MSRVRVLLLDNYDSFTYNLVQAIRILGGETIVHRNDAIGVDDLLGTRPSHIIISPGPCTPNETGVALDLIRAASGSIPVLGVCLGHQCIARVFGARIVRSPHPMHGRASSIRHEGRGLFRDLPSPLRAARYHSLTVEPGSLPDVLRPTAWSEDNLLMGIRHETDPTWGVQFHPESYLTPNGPTLLENFLTA